MRKSYIGWWIASAWALFIYARMMLEYHFYPSPEDAVSKPIVSCLIIVAIIFFYIGYSKFHEYKEYQEDRKIKNDFYKSNTKDSDQ